MSDNEDNLSNIYSDATLDILKANKEYTDTEIDKLRQEIEGILIILTNAGLIE